jgi:hypothetical protein
MIYSQQLGDVAPVSLGRAQRVERQAQQRRYAPVFDQAIIKAAPAPAPALVKGSASPADNGGGIPRPVLIGAGVVGVLAIAAAIYKFTR